MSQMVVHQAAPTRMVSNPILDRFLDGGFKRPAETSSMIGIKGFKHQQYTSDFEDSRADEPRPTAGNDNLTAKLGLLVCERQPHEEPINNEDCRPDSEGHGD